MAVTQIADVIVPAVFQNYITENSLVSTALFQSGVAVQNGEMAAQLSAGAQSFTVPCWNDLIDTEANIGSDDYTVNSVPLKLSTTKQVVRKSFLNQSWSEMNLASELSGSDALAQIQRRVSSWWDRQLEKRIIASLRGVLLSNVANNASDMVIDISGLAGSLANFNGNSVIDTALTLGDRLSAVKSIAMHSFIYGEALKNDEITFFKPSENAIEIPTYKGMSVLIDDNLTPASGVYTTILFGEGAIGYAIEPPRTGYGVELFRAPSAGNGSGQTTLFTRFDVALHPLGFSFIGATVAGVSPTMAELSLAANWTRTFSQRKSIPVAYLVSK
jgi:hypothetical protein